MEQKNGFTLLLIGLGFVTTYCQNATLSSGGEAYGSNGLISYSVGQTVFKAQNGSDGSVLQGVQQAFEISQILGLDEAIGINLLMSVYPNPATDVLTLQVEKYSLDQLSYSLFDLSGRLLEENKVQNNQTNIDLNGLSSSVYFLKVKSKNREIKNFKILKK
jgi:hypothetical protein